MSQKRRSTRRSYVPPAGLVSRIHALHRLGVNASEISEMSGVCRTSVVRTAAGMPCSGRIIRSLLAGCESLERSIADGTRSGGMQWDDSIAERVERRAVEAATVPAPTPKPVEPVEPEPVEEYLRMYPEDDSEDEPPTVDRDFTLGLVADAFQATSTLLLTVGPDAALAHYYLGLAGRAVEKLRG